MSVSEIASNDAWMIMQKLGQTFTDFESHYFSIIALSERWRNLQTSFATAQASFENRTKELQVKETELELISNSYHCFRNDVEIRQKRLESEEEALRERVQGVEMREKQVMEWCEAIDLRKREIVERLKDVEAREETFAEGLERVKAVDDEEERVEERRRAVEESEEALSAREKDIVERSEVLEAKEILIMENLEGLELKEKEIEAKEKDVSEQCLVEERRLSEQREALELKEKLVNEQHRALKSKEKQIKGNSVILKSKEKELDDRTEMMELKEKEIEIKENDVSEQCQALEMKEKQLSKQREELELKTKQVNEQCEALKLKEKKVEESRVRLELKEKQTDGSFLMLKSKEKEFGDCHQTLELREKQVNGLCQTMQWKEKQMEMKDWQLNEGYSILASKMHHLNNRWTQMELRDKVLENRFQALERKEKEIKKHSNAMVSADSQIKKRGKGLKMKEKQHNEVCQTMELEKQMNEPCQVEELKKQQGHELWQVKGLIEKQIDDRCEVEGLKVKQIDEPFCVEGLKEKQVHEHCQVEGLKEKQIDEPYQVDGLEEKQIDKPCEVEVLKVKQIEPCQVEELNKNQSDGHCIISCGKAIQLRDKQIVSTGVMLASQELPHSDISQEVACAIESSFSTGRDIHSLCRNMDVEGVRSYLIVHVKEQNIMQEEILDALILAPDLAKLVLDVIQSFHQLFQSKAETIANKSSCILLLEQMMKLSPEIKSDVKDEAKTLAANWKALLHAGTPRDSFGFFQLLAAFKLASYYDADELLSHFNLLYSGHEVYQPDKNLYLCHAVGLFEKIPGHIKSLIKRKKWLMAVKYVCVFKLECDFPPVPFLEAQLDLVKKKVSDRQKDGTITSKIQAAQMELGNLREIIKCITSLKLESKFPLEFLLSRMKELEEEKKLNEHCHIIKLKEKQVNEPSQAVFKGKQIYGHCVQINEPFQVLGLKEKQINEPCQVEELKEKQITESCQIEELKENERDCHCILSQGKAIDPKEKQIVTSDAMLVSQDLPRSNISKEACVIDFFYSMIGGDIHSLCRNMNADGLRSHPIACLEKQKILPETTLDALRSAPDPAKLVLDVSLGFNQKCQSKEETIANKSSCIFWLEQMMKLSPPITSDVKDEARTISFQWRASLKLNGSNIAIDNYGFLQFLAAFKLASHYCADELLSLFKVFYAGTEVQWPEENSKLCCALGLSEKIPGLIESFITRKKWLSAVKYICVFKLECNFPPLPLLESHLDHIKLRVNESRRDETLKSKIQAACLELSCLQVLIKCITSLKLESKHPLDSLVSRLKELEQEKKLYEQWKSLKLKRRRNYVLHQVEQVEEKQSDETDEHCILPHCPSSESMEKQFGNYKVGEAAT